MLKYSNLLSHMCAKPKVNGRAVHRSTVRSKAKILDGLKISQNILGKLKEEVVEWVNAGNRPPKLVALLIGENPASAVYVKNKMKCAKQVGIASMKLNLPPDIAQEKLVNLIEKFNDDSTIDGILVQLPLPSHIDEGVVSNTILPEKDVDGFNIINMGRLCLGMECFIPCTALGVLELIKFSGIETRGKNAVVCGRSKNVGMPIAMLLYSGGQNDEGVSIAMDATTTICHQHTPPEQLAAVTKKADIIISGVGIPNLIMADMVKEGACVIDIGINRLFNLKTGKNRIVGDVNYEGKGVREVAGFLSPVPGGVGPMTIAMLMKNTLLAAKKSIKYE